MQINILSECREFFVERSNFAGHVQDLVRFLRRTANFKSPNAETPRFFFSLLFGLGPEITSAYADELRARVAHTWNVLQSCSISNMINMEYGNHWQPTNNNFIGRNKTVLTRALVTRQHSFTRWISTVVFARRRQISDLVTVVVNGVAFGLSQRPDLACSESNHLSVLNHSLS